MNVLKTDSSGSAHYEHYELQFQSLRDADHAYVFPCDADGHVNMDALSDAARENYLFARIAVGHDVCTRAVIVGTRH